MRKRPKYEYIEPSVAQYIPQKQNKDKICWISTKEYLLGAGFLYDYDGVLKTIKRWKSR
jgi:hypothetical protein